MSYGETGRASAEMLRQAQGVIADEEQAKLATQDAAEFIAQCGGLTAATVDAPCMRELEEGTKSGAYAADFLAKTMPLGTGTSTLKNYGKIARIDGLARRGCARLGCGRECSAVIANDASIVETNTSHFERTCISE